MSSEGFLSRWSRRKREAAEAEPDESVPLEPPPEAPPPAACPVPGVEEIDPVSLPRIEDLTVSSDLAPFLRPGVPAALRAAALRRMWSVDPAIRDFIGCVDYQWDFNTPGGLPAGFSAELGGEVKKLLMQAIGQRDPEDTAPTPAAEDPVVPDVVAELPSPLRLDEPVEETPPAPVLVRQEEPAERVRRHGGALPS
jgi:hypothetical protein